MSASEPNGNDKHPQPEEEPAKVQVMQARKRIIHPPIENWDVEEIPAQLCDRCNGQASIREGDKRVPCPSCGATGGIPGGKLLIARCAAPYERDDFFLDDDQARDVIQKLGGTVAERPPVTAEEPDSALVLPDGVTA